MTDTAANPIELAILALVFVVALVMIARLIGDIIYRIYPRRD